MSPYFLAPVDPVILSGFGAVICLSVAPLFRERRMVLLAQLAAGLCFATHYTLLGVSVAAAVNVLGLFQTGAALFSTRSSTMTWLGYALIVLMGLVCLVFWQGPFSALSMIAMSLIALGRMQADPLRLRLLLLAGGVFWIAHDSVAEAWIALAADIGAFAMCLAAVAALLVRVTIEWRPSPATPAPAVAGGSVG